MSFLHIFSLFGVFILLQNNCVSFGRLHSLITICIIKYDKWQILAVLLVLSDAWSSVLSCFCLLDFFVLLFILRVWNLSHSVQFKWKLYVFFLKGLQNPFGSGSQRGWVWTFPLDLRSRRIGLKLASFVGLQWSLYKLCKNLSKISKTF